MEGIQAYLLNKKYTEDTAEEFGAVKGAPCQVASTSFDENGNTIVTLSWTNSAGVTKTTDAIIKKGVQGDIGVSVTDAKIDSSNHLVITLSDGSTVDCDVVSDNIWIGTHEEFDAIEVKNPNMIYCVTDDVESEYIAAHAMKMVSLTREEYDALEEKDPDTYYDVDDEEYGLFLDDDYYDTDIETQKSKINSMYKTTPHSITIYVDNENGDDDNDGLTQETPIKHMTSGFLGRKYGNIRGYVIYLLSDYDLEGTAFSSNAQSLNLYGGLTESDKHRFYSSVDFTSSSMVSFSATSKVNMRYIRFEMPNVMNGSGYFISFSSGNGYIASCDFVMPATINKKPTAFIEATRSMVYISDDTFDIGSTANVNVPLFYGGCGHIYVYSGSTVLPVTYFFAGFGSSVCMYSNGSAFKFEYTTLDRYKRGNIIYDGANGGIPKGYLQLPLPECTETTAGTYSLKATVDDTGVVSYSWVADSTIGE